MVAENQLVGSWFVGRAGDSNESPYEAVLYTLADVQYGRAFHDDGVLDFAALDVAVVVDRGEGTDVGIDDARARADHHGSSYDTADNLDARLYGGDADDARVGMHVPFEPGRYHLEHPPVRLKDILHFTGVGPVSVQMPGFHGEFVVDEVLQRIGDLVFAAGGGLEAVDCFEDVVIE